MYSTKWQGRQPTDKTTTDGGIFRILFHSTTFHPPSTVSTVSQSACVGCKIRPFPLTFGFCTERRCKNWICKGDRHEQSQLCVSSEPNRLLHRIAVLANAFDHDPPPVWWGAPTFIGFVILISLHKIVILSSLGSNVTYPLAKYIYKR